MNINIHIYNYFELTMAIACFATTVGMLVQDSITKVLHRGSRISVWSFALGLSLASGFFINAVSPHKFPELWLIPGILTILFAWAAHIDNKSDKLSGKK